jgi:hypothetical protein
MKAMKTCAKLMSMEASIIGPGLSDFGLLA